MSFNNIKTKLRQERGFTIVELLIVIVVIGILAAITIVSFNGVTARANTANAQSAAEATIKKAEAYNAELSSYPTSGYQLINAAASTSYQLTGVTFNDPSELTGTTAPGSASVLNFYKCANATGIQVSYFDYSAKSWKTQVTGNCTTPTFNKGTATS